LNVPAASRQELRRVIDASRANLIKITDVTGHRSLEMLKTYSRDAEAFVGHARRGTAVGGDMTHEDQVALEILSELTSG
jgi:hypothetical protein